MPKLINVRTPYLRRLRQITHADLLLFDEIFFYEFDSLLADDSVGYLIEKKVVTFTEETHPPTTFETDLEILTLADRGERAGVGSQATELITRLWTVHLQAKSEDFYVSALGVPPQLELPGSAERDLVDVVLRKFAVPVENVPIEDVLAYRNDSETQLHLTALRSWLFDAAAEQLPLKQASQKLDYLVHQHERHIELCRLEHKLVTTRALLKVPINFVKGILTLDADKIVDPLFEVALTKVKLKQAEYNSPGKMIAAIVGANERFSKASNAV